MLKHQVSPMNDLMDRDAGFCPADYEDDVHSPTDASEDSIDVKVQAISLKNKNKRKCAEPRRVDTELPAKKRKVEIPSDTTTVKIRNSSPFRPWSRSPTPNKTINTTIIPISRHSTPSSQIILPISTEYFNRSQFSPPPTRLPLHIPVCPLTPSKPSLIQEEPLSLVSKKKEIKQQTQYASWHTPIVDVRHPNYSVITKQNKLVNSDINTEENDDKFRIETILSNVNDKDTTTDKDNQRKTSQQQQQQRNYKNMTRERRIEANARERTRVHTISAAFDTLRHSVPAYSHNQKLSKLSVLRIACSYIMTLSRLAGYDYSLEQNEPDLSECIDNVSRTIQTEGKLRKKKDD